MGDTIAAAKPPKLKGAALLRLIGVFKAAKAALLIAAAISVFKLVHKDVGSEIIEWARRLHIAPGNRYVESLVERVLTVTQKQLVVIGVVLLAYAAMFLVEGVGLLMLKHWAEWMTVITTSGLIPFEVYELVHRRSWLKLITMAINVAVAVYLAARVLRESKEKRAQRDVSPS